MLRFSHLAIQNARESRKYDPGPPNQSNLYFRLDNLGRRAQHSLSYESSCLVIYDASQPETPPSLREGTMKLLA
jgi:hypothetical protein